MFFKEHIKYYKNFFLIGLKSSMYYKIAILLEFLFSLLTLIFLYYFWTTLGDSGVSFVDSRFILYIIISFALATTLILDWDFVEIIKSDSGTAIKDLTYLITRNINPLSYDARTRARTIVIFILVITIVLSFLHITNSIELSLLKIISVIPFFIISHFLISLFSLLISYFAFWFDEAWAFGVSFHFILSFASGSVLPLYIMPEILESILVLLPFQFLAYVPAQILIEDLTLREYFSLFFLGLFWLVIIGFLSKIIYRKGLKKFESQGG